VVTTQEVNIHITSQHHGSKSYVFLSSSSSVANSLVFSYPDCSTQNNQALQSKSCYVLSPILGSCSFEWIKDHKTVNNDLITTANGTQAKKGKPSSKSK